MTTPATGIKSITIDGLEYRYYIGSHVIKVAPGWATFSKHATRQEAEEAWRELGQRADVLETTDADKLMVVPPRLRPGEAAVGRVDEDAAALRADFDQAELAERDACLRYVRIGMRCLTKKDQLGHGNFTPWLEAAITQVRQRRAQKYMQIAQACIDGKRLSTAHILALCGSDETPERKQAEQMLLDFIGGRTQTELLSELGRTKLGGAREGAGRPAKTSTYLREVAEKYWSELMGKIHQDTTAGRPDRQYARLPVARLKQIAAGLLDAKRVIDQLIAKG